MTGVKPFDNFQDYLVELGQTALLGAITGGAAGLIAKGGLLAAMSLGGKVGVMGAASFLGSAIDQAVDVWYFKEGFNLSEFFLNGAVGTIVSAIGLGAASLAGRAPAAVQGALTKGPGSNTWNNFQSNFAKIVPWATTPSSRAAVYNALKSLAGNPQPVEDVVNTVVSETLNRSIENNPLGNGPGLTADSEKGPGVVDAVASPDKVKNENFPKVTVPDELTGKKKK